VPLFVWPDPAPGGYPLERTDYAFQVLPGLRWLGVGLMRLRLRATDAAAIRDVARRPDGALVRVRGRVRAAAPLASLLEGGAAVYRQTHFTLLFEFAGVSGFPLVHEAAVDFELHDDAGSAVQVLAAGAHVARRTPAQRPVTQAVAERILAVPLPRAVEQFRGAPIATPLSAAELLVRDGDEVEVFGVKDRVVDPRRPALARDTPFAAALRSARGRPLLVLPSGFHSAVRSA